MENAVICKAPEFDANNVIEYNMGESLFDKGILPNTFNMEFRASFYALGVMYKNILKWCKDENYSFKHWEQDSQTSNFIICVLDETGNEKEFVFTKDVAVDKFYK